MRENEVDPGIMRRFAVKLLFVMAVAVPLWAAVPARRLNRYEYNCTVRDLLGVDFRSANDFPADNFSYGFDNNAATLTVTPALLAKYLQAAKKIARAAVEPVPLPATPELERHSNALPSQARHYLAAKFHLGRRLRCARGDRRAQRSCRPVCFPE